MANFRLVVDTAKSLPFSRSRKMECDTVVLHATAGSTFRGAFAALMDRELSYHYIIEDQRETDGLVRKLVPASRVAYHAGRSFGPHGSGVNDYSLGISFVNRNDGADGYSWRQFNAARAIIIALKSQFPLKWLTTHALISPGRKTDPRNFPVDDLAEAVGLKVWRP
jgi:N-acetyl-anhydromuramyl-L-alanine amidase AmpD